MKNPVEELPDFIDAKESDYLYLKKSGITDSGKGLFTSIHIYKNEVISIFKGEILSNKEAAFRANNKNDGYFINMLDGSIMDSMHIKCFAKYANDSEGFKKSSFRNNSKIALDENNKVCLVATRDIKINEEIFCGYGTAYWKNFKN
ncbi:MAG: SET domain-containing protein [Burkholderiales bacterium]|nr:SET domain-containing protein [Bacteroidia bacterium]